MKSFSTSMFIVAWLLASMAFPSAGAPTDIEVSRNNTAVTLFDMPSTDSKASSHTTAPLINMPATSNEDLTNFTISLAEKPHYGYDDLPTNDEVMCSQTHWKTDHTYQKGKKAALAEDCWALAHRLAAGPATWRLPGWRINRYRHIMDIGTCAIGAEIEEILNFQSWVGNQDLINAIVESLNEFSRESADGVFRLQVEGGFDCTKAFAGLLAKVRWSIHRTDGT